MQILCSFLESWTYTVLDKLASTSLSKGELQTPTKFGSSSRLKDFETPHPCHLSISAKEAARRSLLASHPLLPPSTRLQWIEVPERGWETKVAFTQSLLKRDSRGGVCSPEAGCRPVTLSSKMCEISFCWVFYIKRNLFSEKHSISQTLMAFLCADALMRLWLVLIRRKPCR